MIADTDVLIDFVMGEDPGASWVAEALERGQLSTTVITRFELQRGARRAKRPEVLEALLARLEAFPLLAPAADRAAHISRDLAERGQALAEVDCLIAGIVLEHGESLLTRNRRHFARIPGLRLADLAVEGEINEPEGEAYGEP